MELIDVVGKYAASLAAVGILLLVPLYLSQRRDLTRLRAWMEADADHPGANLAASEGILDRAEAELEALEAATTPPAVPSPAAPPPLPAQRVAGERPALQRITMERAALQPHPRWRRFVAVATQPRVLVAIAAVSVVAGIGGIFASDRLLTSDEPSGGGRRPGAVDPHDVRVAVLNGTDIPGLAANVGTDVRENGFELGTVTNSDRPYDQTVVMFQRGQQAAAEKLAHDLGIRPVQPIDEQTRQDAADADVVVIAGADRASP